ncbi:androgen-dependent TFPI-regulating protein-like [Sycon ciliatum]|uniref:androgen-dependent TFPI-regulating protein-like n=1 Tax=Sycon ciliatum TaxID=27933 RepID=UPI0031F69BAC
MAAERSVKSPIWLVLLFHSFVTGVYVFMRVEEYQRLSALAAQNKIFPGYDRMGERYKYLTQINMYIQLGFFAMATIGDVAQLLRAPRALVCGLQKIVDVVFATLAFPLSEFIVCIFWPIYIYDRELIFPTKLDEHLPFYVNYLDHLFIGVWVMIEMLLVRHKYPSVKVGMAVTAAFGATYTSIVFYIAHYGGFWVYPFMTVMSPVVRGVFFVAMFSLVFAIFYAGRKLNALVWGSTSSPDSASTKQKQKQSLRRKKVH